MEKIKILDFTATDILIRPVGRRLYELPKDVRVQIKTKSDGTLNIFARKGFKFDGRSGGPFADFIAPNLGNQRILACWLVHDILGHDFDISFDTTNEILDQMLECAGMSDFKSDVIEWAVSLSDGWFGCKTDSERANKLLCGVFWGD